MVRSKWTLLFYVIIGFGAIGLFSQLFTQPGNFFKGIFMTLGIGLAIFAVIYFVFLKKRTPSNDMKKYKKAVKQSQAKYKKDDQRSQSTTKTPTQKQPNLVKKKRSKRTAAHLKVIEGNKAKRKDRA